MPVQDDDPELVSRHYGREGLVESVLMACAARGGDPGHPTVADLSAVDQLHLGSADASRFLLERLGVGTGTRLLDVGSGLGGPSRLAAELGAQVVGVDVTSQFVAASTELTALVGLAERATYQITDGRTFDLPDASFDTAMQLHVGMNVPDKARLFGEIRRVLVAGGRFGIYDQFRLGGGELPFPLPWADDERSSFVESPEEYADHLHEAGFVVDLVEDRTITLWAEDAAGSDGDRPAPPDYLGVDLAERILRDLTAIRAGQLAPMVVVATAA